MIRIRIRNADRRYQSQRNIFAKLVEQALQVDVKVVAPSAPADCEFVATSTRLSSGLTQQITRRYAGPGASSIAQLVSARNRPSDEIAISFWFTGENERPPTGAWSGSFSFDLDPLAGSNVYFPLWFETLGTLGCEPMTFLRRPLTITDAIRQREPHVSANQRFMCAFIGKWTPMRRHAIELFSQLGTVDVFGRAGTRELEFKDDVQGQYKFCLCFENDLYPGYVTEKAFEAWALQAIPVWWGYDPAGYINEAAVVDVAKLGLGAATARIQELLNDNDLRAEFVSRPVLSRRPDLHRAEALITEQFSLRSEP